MRRTVVGCQRPPVAVGEPSAVIVLAITAHDRPRSGAGPDSDEIRMLVGLREPARPGFVLFDAWDAAVDGAGTGTTWSRSNPWAGPTLFPDRRIDYIFTGWPRRGGVGSVVTAGRAGIEPISGVVASDHYAVYADIRY